MQAVLKAREVVEGAQAVWEAVLERCCGLDVHQKMVTACLLIGALDHQPKESIRTFPTTTKGLMELRDWLEDNSCTHVAIESTGIYWRPVFHILEGAMTVLLVNAYHLKQVPGRKTDLKDAQWIARLLRWGFNQTQSYPPEAHQGAPRAMPLSEEAHRAGVCREESDT